MQAMPEFLFDLSEFGLHALPDSLPKHDEPSTPGTVTRVCEPQEVERFRLSLAMSPAILGSVPPKFDQACFGGVQFQMKLMETLP